MKAQTLLKFTVGLFTLLLVYSFIPNETNRTGDNIVVTYSSPAYSNRVLITYRRGITEGERFNMRDCFANSLGGYISYIVPCSTNSNAEFVYFSNIGIEPPTRNDENESTNDEIDNGMNPALGGMIVISDLDMNIAAFNCGLISASSVRTCDDLSGLIPSMDN